MKELEGKIVEKVFVDDKQHTLVFVTDTGEQIAYATEADCCSETWFADIVGIEAILGYKSTSNNLFRKIREIQLLDMEWYPVEDGRSRQETDRAYGYRLWTPLGRTAIAFRNSSNGYYGGNISLCKVQIDTSKMKQITEDWHA